MKRLFTFAAAGLVAAVLLCAGISAFDANDYDYSYDYSYDYDDDDYSYGGGYSSWDDDDDDYSYSGGSGGSGEMTWEEMLFMIGIVVVMLYLGGRWASKPSKNSGKQRQQPSRSRNKQVTVPNRNVEVRDAVRQSDPSFGYEPMIAFAQKTFVDVQNAWCARDLEPVRGIMHNNLYNTTMKQVQSKIDQHVTYHYENYTFKNVYLTSYVRDSEYEYVTVYLNTEYIDYQTNDDTGEIIRGDKTTMWKMRYLMKFMRSIGGASDQPKFCPNCGAPLDISSSGKCEYCGSTVTTGSFDWLLSDFTTVRADTKDDGIRV
ncbi:MAG: TIM44-like domain-containing protein [Ruminiclostridium sp.]|nr:TIM44-like domain-containing protein [Ruminiclostridium sp.]